MYTMHLLRNTLQSVALLSLFITICPAQNYYQNVETSGNTLLKLLGFGRTMHELDQARKGKVLVTNLDNMRNLFVGMRRFLLDRMNINDITRSNRARGKMQRIVPRSEPFPCNLTYGRSLNAPTSVNRLRPGDIDIIASLGDSLSAGNGVISETVTDIINEVRGITFSGGGQGTWREYLTLPNIIKAYNPRLYGYSTASGLTIDESSHLNMAEPMIMSRDLSYQVTALIDRMRHDPSIDMKRHWKMLTIFVGNNDICSDSCHYTDINVFLKRHEVDLRRALTILRKNVPRLVVNILSPPNVITALYPMKNKPFICTAIHLVGCHCVFSQRIGPEKLAEISNYITRWQKIDELVSYSPEFQTEDFAVLYHPFVNNISTPTLPNGATDYRFFASDCFHFSQLGQASVANTLWNSLLEPVDNRRTTIHIPFKEFECPTPERPYIATLRNSLENLGG